MTIAKFQFDSILFDSHPWIYAYNFCQCLCIGIGEKRICCMFHFDDCKCECVYANQILFPFRLNCKRYQFQCAMEIFCAHKVFFYIVYKMNVLNEMQYNDIGKIKQESYWWNAIRLTIIFYFLKFPFECLNKPFKKRIKIWNSDAHERIELILCAMSWCGMIETNDC